MSIKLQLNDKIGKYIVILFKLLAFSLAFLFGLTLNVIAEEKATASSPSLVAGASDVNSANKASTSPKLNTDLLLNEAPALNNSAIIQSTDFSKTGFTKQAVNAVKPGFSNKIVLTSNVDYDSNPAFSTGSRDPVWIYTLTPQVLLDYNSEFNKFYLDGALVIQRLSNEAVLPKREDPRLNIGWDRVYESGVYGLFASYNQLLSRAQQIRTTGFFTPGLDGENTQRTKSFGAKWDHNISQRWSLLSNAVYTKDTFSGGVNLFGSTLLDLRTRLNYEYTEKLNTYVQVGYVELRPDGPVRDTDLYRMAFGADYDFSQGFKAAFRAAKYRLSGGESDNDWEGGVLFTYDTEQSGYTAELTRELTPGGGLGGFQLSDTFRLGWIVNLSEVDGFNLGYSINKLKAGDAGFPEQEFREFSAGYNRLLGANWNARANLSYRELIDSENNNAEGVLVGISLIYSGFSF